VPPIGGEVPWRPTAAHVRAVLGGTALALAAVLLRRPDLLVIATPLLVVALWSTLTRPGTLLSAEARLRQTTLREDEATTWQVRVQLAPRTEQVVCVAGPSPYVALHPASGVRVQGVREQDGHGHGSQEQVAQTRVVHGQDEDGRFEHGQDAHGQDAHGQDEHGQGDDGQDERMAGSRRTAVAEVAVQSRRWGRRAVAPGLVAAGSSWGAFRWGPVELPPLTLTTLPLPATFDAAAPAPHPSGLVGLNRSSRPGDGSEFAGIRPFRAGDRLRRVHWPRSLRTGELHVTSTFADQDGLVVLVVDALSDVGRSEGVGGAASSLDTTVRAAGAVAEHHLRRGDRVGVQIVGTTGVTRVPPSTGGNHLRRVLDTLALIEVGTDPRPPEARLRLGLGADAMVVMLSPLVSPVALQQAVTLARHGLTVVVIDTLPSDLHTREEDELTRLAWRIRLLEREHEVQQVQEAGIPVVPWRGPGSLDQVLRDLGRRSGVPRMVRR